MAGTLAHITLADRALDRANLPHDLYESSRLHIKSFHLGAIFADLPYYENLWINGLRTLAHRPFQFSSWGTDLHLGAPTDLMLALLDSARGRSGLAFALGALTHYAVDIVFHREIEGRIRAHDDGRLSHTLSHKRLEDEVDWYVQTGLLGHGGMGTPYARRMVLYPNSGWVRQARNALTRVIGRAPGRVRLHRWQANLALFGLLSAGGASFGVIQNRSIDPELQTRSMEMASEATDLAAQFIGKAVAYTKGALDRERFLRDIPNRSMLDGATL